jgi:hypothetical protein
MLNLSDYINQLQESQKEANAANEQRLKEVTALYDEIIAQYSTGGSAEKAGLAQIEEAKKSSVSQGTQALVNSGFANSTMMATLGSQFEKDVGATARLTLESTLADKLAAAKTGKATMLENVQDVGPDDSLVANLISQAAQPTTKTVITAPSKMGSIFDEFTSNKTKTSKSTPTTSSSNWWSGNSKYWTSDGRWIGGE